MSEIEKRIDAAWNEAFDHGEQQGADLERRRIRRALVPVIAGLRKDMRFDVVEYIDAATRAVPRKKK